MTRKYFGTDGIRGRVGEPPITADFMLRLGRAAGRTLGNGRRRSVVIGKDTRISGYMFESALEAGLAAAGADILLLGPMPTPAVAHLTRSLGAAAGIVISASHNPYEDNGVKFFGPDGRKLSDSLERAMEAELDAPFDQVASDRLGRASRIDDAAGRYIEFCKSAVPFGTSLRGLRLVVDCAHGATYRVAPEVLRELGASVGVIGNQPDGMNINLDCGSTRPRALIEQVRARGADAGIALDGDGDRAILVDAEGRIIDGDRILYILACARQEAGELGGGVVGTVMSNFGLEQALKSLDIPFLRAAVGDRHVHEMLVEQGWILGGETSGHVLTLDRATTGDGIVSAVQVLARMAVTGKTLAELAGGMRHYPQVMINVPVDGNARNALDGSAEISNAVAMVESELAGRGRVILRASGTEPLVRVTVEGHDENQVRRLAEGLAEVVAAEAGTEGAGAAP